MFEILSIKRVKFAITNFVADHLDECLDIEWGGTWLLTRGIGAFQTASGFSQSSSFAQSGVLDVVEIVFQRLTALPTSWVKHNIESVSNWLIANQFCQNDTYRTLYVGISFPVQLVAFGHNARSHGGHFANFRIQFEQALLFFK